MKILLILLVFLSANRLFSQQTSVPVESWKSYPVPSNKDTLRSYNNSPNDWTVFLKDTTVFITNSRHFKRDTLPFKIKLPDKGFNKRGRMTFLPVNDGYLVGLYRGEWGGNLFWFSKDGQTDYEISDHEIVQFIKRNNKIYAIQGLSHMSIDEGSVIQILKYKGKWTAQEYSRLPFAPYAVQLDSRNNFIVVTSSNLIFVISNTTIQILVKDGMWTYLYPSSMVIQKGIAFIGMRKGVYKVDLSTKKEEWLLPD